MAKRASIDELTWLVTDAFNGVQRREKFKIAVAIVPDKSVGWRAIIDLRSRRYMSESLITELAKVEDQLRQEYRLVAD